MEAGQHLRQSLLHVQWGQQQRIALKSLRGTCPRRIEAVRRNQGNGGFMPEPSQMLECLVARFVVAAAS